MGIRELTQEEYEKIVACTTPEDFSRLVETKGIDLSDEELAMISGGESNAVWDEEESDPMKNCPRCGSTSLTINPVKLDFHTCYVVHCNICYNCYNVY